jgi:hypothetical protein
MGILAALLLVVTCVAVSYWLWIAPLEARLNPMSRGLLFLVSLTLAGGFLGAPLWWLDKEGAFAWNLPPLAARMLASAGWAFAVASVLTLRRPTHDRLKVHLVMLVVYLAPLAAAIVAMHLDRFDADEPVVWGFFPLVILMTISSLYFLLRTPKAPVTGDAAAPLPATVAWLTAVALVTALWGVALFLTDDGFSDDIWVWPGDQLTSELIGVMLLTVAAGSAWSLRSREPALTVLATAATYGFGVAVANVWSSFQDKPVRESYVVAFAIIGLGSLALLAMESRRTAALPARAT